jgi:hypothetical protein
MLQLKQLLDREAIRDAMGRYCRGIDRLDADLIRSAYHEDAWDDHGPFKGNREEFVEWIIPHLRRSYQVTCHNLTTMSIKLDGATAYVETYGIAMEQTQIDGKRIQLIANCRYVDRFEERGGDWRIAHRLCVTDAGRADEVTDWPGAIPGAWTVGSRDHTDPVYAVELRAPDEPGEKRS